MKRNTQIKLLPISVFCALFVIIVVLLCTNGKVGEDFNTISMEEVQDDRIKRLELAYVEAKKQILNKDETIRNLESIINEQAKHLEDYQELIQMLTEEQHEVKQKAAYEAHIREQFQIFKRRVGLTPFQDRNIKSWLETYAGRPENKYNDLHEYLQKIMSPNQYKSYQAYEDSQRKSIIEERAISILSDIRQRVDLTEEQEDLVWEAATSTISSIPPYEEDDETLEKELEEIFNEQQLLTLKDSYTNEY